MAVQNEGFNTLGTKANVSLTTDKKIYAGTIIEVSREISDAGLDDLYDNTLNNFIGQDFVLQSRKFTENGHTYINFDPMKNGEKDPAIVDSFQVLYDRDKTLNNELRAKTFNEAIDYITKENFIFTTKNTKFVLLTASGATVKINRTDVEIPIVIKEEYDGDSGQRMTVFFSSIRLDKLLDLTELEQNGASSDYIAGTIKIKDEIIYALGFYNLSNLAITPGNNFYYDNTDTVVDTDLDTSTTIFFDKMDRSNTSYMVIDTNLEGTTSSGYLQDESLLVLLYSIFTGKDFYRTISTNSSTTDYVNISPDEIFPMFKNFRPDIDMDGYNNFILKNWDELSYILYYYGIPDDALQVGIIRKGKNNSGKKINYNGNNSIRKKNESRGLACKFSETFSAFGDKQTNDWKVFYIQENDKILNKNGRPSATIINSGEFIRNRCTNKYWVIPDRNGNFSRYRNHYFFHLIFKINMSKISPDYVRKNGKTADPRCFRSWYSIDQMYDQSTKTCEYKIRHAAPRFVSSHGNNSEERYYGEVFD